MSCRHQIKRSAVEVRHSNCKMCCPVISLYWYGDCCFRFSTYLMYLSVFPWPAPAASSGHINLKVFEQGSHGFCSQLVSKASRLTFTPPPRSFPWPLGTPVSPVVVNGVLVCLAACCNELISVACRHEARMAGPFSCLES